MGLGKKLLTLAASLVVFNVVLWGLPKIAPQVPDRYEGVSVAARPPAAAPKTTAPSPLPSGFPSMDRPPPKIVVPDGQAQPIATKFGLTYDVPADWQNASTGFGGWEDATGWSIVYGAIGRYGYESCSAQNGSTLGLSGATGSADGDLIRVATEHSRNSSKIFSAAAPGTEPTVSFSEPREITIAGSRGIRITTTVADVVQDSPCDPPAAIFDIVTTVSYATAVTAVFMVQLDQGVDGAADRAVADRIFSTIRRS
ncbi:hypothetical protein QMK17_13160 [Rhodococcus sp. G-MC3]|uniref:hypothetical protein n=1 Tax=Rhodococcus sp. G-MC3 TaxID=3046209 RepID=UPI0024B9602A|nr:hypothetical protein [Rhodococcus sp. G-MC3]MDJ0394275.1 hypothetical protein [Rhodococcus sp. G-MC3]